MEMSEHDIYVEFKNAKDPSKQIQILAELNATTPEAIAEIVNKKRREERKTVTEEEKKAKKAAYMKKYWERKKAEKEAAEKSPEVIPIVEEKNEDTELILKALLHYHMDLIEAIEEQQMIVEEQRQKLETMQKDLDRLNQILKAKEEGA